MQKKAGKARSAAQLFQSEKMAFISLKQCLLLRRRKSFFECARFSLLQRLVTSGQAESRLTNKGERSQEGIFEFLI